MAQGEIKKGAKKQPQHPKRTERVAKPKKAKSSKAQKAIKKFSSGMIAQTEAMLGERAGHLELIGKGKKGERTAKKGGSKKFG